MFSPPNIPAVSHWFQRLDAAWRRMPAEEQTRQREEVQQHLDGLVAAKVAQGQTNENAWNAALMQFGDPTQIGRKMYQEWRQSRTGFRADMSAILFGFGLQMLICFIYRVIAIMLLPRFYNPSDKLYTHGAGIPFIVRMVCNVLGYGLPVLINAAIGRKYPSQAVKGAFYGDVFWNLCCWIPLAGIICTDPRHYHSATVFLTYSILWMPVWLVGQVIVAYLASVTKRGWYRPTRDDFKLTLPSRRRQMG